METAMKVRRRILVNNESIRSVAKETGLSRNTIRKYCRDDAPPKYKHIAPNFSPNPSLTTKIKSVTTQPN